MTNPERESETTDQTDRRTVLKGAALAGLGGAGTLTGRASAHPKPHTITVKAGDTPFEYRIRVSGEIAKGEFSGTTDEIVDGNVVVGFVEKGNAGELDNYHFSGRITEFKVFRGSARAVAVNGQVVDDPVGLPRPGLPNRITVQAEGEDVRYAFRVSGRVEKGPEANAGDRIVDSNRVEAIVGGNNIDDYRYSGGIAFAEPDGPLTVTLDFDP